MENAKSLRYISKGLWFDKDTEATLIDDYRKDGLDSGLFEGIKNGTPDEEICGFDEFEVIQIEEKDTSVIPKGDYCYTTTSEMVEYTREDGQKIKVPKTIPCPYWSLREDKPEQENGYCAYLDEGDWSTNEGLEIFDPKTGKTSELEILVGLLWDQVKSCDINKWTDAEWEEMYGRGEVTRVESDHEIEIPEDCPIIRKKQKIAE